MSLAALEAAGAENLRGKVMLDARQPARTAGRRFPGVGRLAPRTRWPCSIQQAYPETDVVKALNTMNNQVMVHPERIPGDHVVFLSGDSDAAKDQVRELLRAFGWRDVQMLDLGGIDAAAATRDDDGDLAPCRHGPRLGHAPPFNWAIMSADQPADEEVFPAFRVLEREYLLLGELCRHAVPLLGLVECPTVLRPIRTDVVFSVRLPGALNTGTCQLNGSTGLAATALRRQFLEPEQEPRAINGSRRTSRQGWELAFATNHLRVDEKRRVRCPPFDRYGEAGIIRSLRRLRSATGLRTRLQSATLAEPPSVWIRIRTDPDLYQASAVGAQQRRAGRLEPTSDKGEVAVVLPTVEQ